MGNRIVKYIFIHASEFAQEKISISFYVIGELLPYFWTFLVKCKKKDKFEFLSLIAIEVPS